MSVKEFFRSQFVPQICKGDYREANDVREDADVAEREVAEGLRQVPAKCWRERSGMNRMSRLIVINASP